MTPKRKWDHPSDWLMEKIEEGRERDLRMLLNTILSALDGDTIQDLFQDDMSDDGYFTRLCDVEGCDELHAHFDTRRKLYVCSEHLTETQTTNEGETE